MLSTADNRGAHGDHGANSSERWTPPARHRAPMQETVTGNARVECCSGSPIAVAPARMPTFGSGS